MVGRHLRGAGALALPITAVVLVMSIVVAVGTSEAPRNQSEPPLALELSRVAHTTYWITDFAFTADGRILMTEKEGRIRVVQPDGKINDELFLDLSSQVSTDKEEGLVSIALHPSFEQNGIVYISYTDLEKVSQIVRYRVSDDNADVADPTSAFTILSVPQPSPMHNGGELVFGPDDYLYAGFGDGGPDDDPDNKGQDGQSLMGAILRIDVDNPAPGEAYGIPADNPFVDEPAVADEIWAMGLRNPWRFSFDSLTGDLFIGDVGQDQFEEINFERAPSSGGANYGWRCYEGNAEHLLDDCEERDEYEFPIIVLPHPEVDPAADLACAIVGGMVHRGDPEALLYGQYIFADHCSGLLWAAAEVEPDQWQVSNYPAAPLSRPTAFGRDESGDLYVADLNNIYRISAREMIIKPSIYLPLVADRVDL
jgi:glucose/arabinose dehydrogenase